MSKKIKIPSNNIKSRLGDLFHSFIFRKYKADKKRSNYYDEMDDEELMWLMQQQGFIFRDIYDDDDYANFYASDDDDDDSDVIWPPTFSKNKGKGGRTADDIYDEFWNRESKRGKRKHRKGKKARVININEPYSGEEEDDVNDFDYTSYEEVESDDNGLSDGKEIYYYPDYHDKDARLEFSTLKAFNEFCDDNGYVVPSHVGNMILFNRVSHCCLHPQSRDYGLYEIIAETSYGNLFYEVCEASELGD